MLGLHKLFEFLFAFQIFSFKCGVHKEVSQNSHYTTNKLEVITFDYLYVFHVILHVILWLNLGNPIALANPNEKV